MKNFKLFSFILNLITGLIFAFISITISILTIVLFIDRNFKDEMLLKLITLITFILIKFYAELKVKKNNAIDSIYFRRLLIIDLIDAFVAFLIIYFEIFYLAAFVIIAWFLYAIIMTVFLSDSLKEMMKSEGLYSKFFKDGSRDNESDEEDTFDDEDDNDEE